MCCCPSVYATLSPLDSSPESSGLGTFGTNKFNEDVIVAPRITGFWTLGSLSVASGDDGSGTPVALGGSVTTIAWFDPAAAPGFIIVWPR
jgi:hypothetical protein